LLFGRVAFLVYKVFDITDFFTESPFLPDFLSDWVVKPILMLIGFYFIIILLIFRYLNRLDAKEIYLKILIGLTIASILFMDEWIYSVFREWTRDMVGML
jgi:hypothetical protein